MNLRKQIDMLVCSDNKQAYNALKELLVITDQCNALYSYFDIFVEMMNNQDNSYIRTRSAYNSK